MSLNITINHLLRWTLSSWKEKGRPRSQVPIRTSENIGWSTNTQMACMKYPAFNHLHKLKNQASWIGHQWVLTSTWYFPPETSRLCRGHSTGACRLPAAHDCCDEKKTSCLRGSYILNGKRFPLVEWYMYKHWRLWVPIEAKWTWSDDSPIIKFVKRFSRMSDKTANFTRRDRYLCWRFNKATATGGLPVVGVGTNKSKYELTTIHLVSSFLFSRVCVE